MILKRIVEFAEKHAAGVPSGYQPRFVTKVIDLRPDGTLRSVSSMTGDRRGAREGRERLEPQEAPRRASGIAARLLADNVNYVLGKAREKDKPEQVLARHLAWRKLVVEAGESLEISELKAVQIWITSGGPEALRDDPSIEETDDFTFSVDDVFLTDLPAIRSWWANRSSASDQGQCLITGAFGRVTDRMPSMIKGIPGGQMSGTALVSVNNAAGESYGNSAALNSPISPDAAEKLCNGLNLLINTSSVDKDGKTKYKYALRVDPSVYVAWCRRDEDEFSWDMLNEPDPEHVQQLIRQSITGEEAPNVAEADFYMLSLSANAARIIVRDQAETTLANVKHSLGKWFRRLEIAGVARPFGIYRLAASLYRDRKEMPAHVPSDLIAAALNDRRIPEYLLGLAVKRNLAMQGPFELTLAKTKALSTSRLTLIKAALTPDAEDTSLNELNQEHENPAYHCGRMLAVLESIQRNAATSKLNATLVDRNYGAACASPASVFGKLLKDATTAHLPKLRKNRKGAYYALDQRLQEVALAVGDNFPKTLSLRDQGLFSLGYYHQRAWDYAEAKKNRDLADEESAQEESDAL